MSEPKVIDGWKCEVVGGGYRRASSSIGAVVMLMDDGRLSTERATVPVAVVVWLMQPMIDAAAMKGGELTIDTIHKELQSAGFNLPDRVKP